MWKRGGGGGGGGGAYVPLALKTWCDKDHIEKKKKIVHMAEEKNQTPKKRNAREDKDGEREKERIILWYCTLCLETLRTSAQGDVTI